MDSTETVPEIDLEQIKHMAILAVRNAVIDSFRIMAGMDAAVGDEYIVSTPIALAKGVAGVIGWAGVWSGSGVLECTPEFACELSNCMLGTEHTELSEDALDAVAEMANIIFGSMKTKMEWQFGILGLSTPTVFYGDNVGMRGSGRTFTVIPVQIAQHALQVKLFIPGLQTSHPDSHPNLD